MKRRVWVVVVLALMTSLLWGSMQTFAQDGLTAGDAVQTVDSLNIREEPDESARLLGTVLSGNNGIYQRSQQGSKYLWALVEFPEMGITGWVVQAYLVKGQVDYSAYDEAHPPSPYPAGTEARVNQVTWIHIRPDVNAPTEDVVLGNGYIVVSELDILYVDNGVQFLEISYNGTWGWVDVSHLSPMWVPLTLRLPGNLTDYVVAVCAPGACTWEDWSNALSLQVTQHSAEVTTWWIPGDMPVWEPFEVLVDGGWWNGAMTAAHCRIIPTWTNAGSPYLVDLNKVAQGQDPCVGVNMTIDVEQQTLPQLVEPEPPQPQGCTLTITNRTGGFLPDVWLGQGDQWIHQGALNLGDQMTISVPCDARYDCSGENSAGQCFWDTNGNVPANGTCHIQAPCD